MRWGMMSALLVAASAACSAHAQPLPSGTTPNEKGPKTLLEALSGTAPRAAESHSEEEDRIEPDRPHFPEATSAVGKGRAILESGYTFSRKGDSQSHSFPEALLRVGVLADWFELRVGQSAALQRQTFNGTTTTTRGLQDTYLGFKVAVMDQQGFLPAVAVIPQMTVPTGDPSLTAGRVLPGVNVDFSWEVIRKLFSIEVVITNNRVRDDFGSTRHELGTGLTGAVHLTKNLEAFVEWNAFYPSSGFGSAGPRHYAVGGLVYFINSNLAVDVRAGVGLSERSDAFISGVGFAARF